MFNGRDWCVEVQRCPTTFVYGKDINRMGAVSVVVRLMPREEWPRLWTEPLDIRLDVLAQWWTENVAATSSGTVH